MHALWNYNTLHTYVISSGFHDFPVRRSYFNIHVLMLVILILLCHYDASSSRRHLLLYHWNIRKASFALRRRARPYFSISSHIFKKFPAWHSLTFRSLPSALPLVVYITSVPAISFYLPIGFLFQAIPLLASFISDSTLSGNSDAMEALREALKGHIWCALAFIYWKRDIYFRLPHAFLILSRKASCLRYFSCLPPAFSHACNGWTTVIINVACQPQNALFQPPFSSLTTYAVDTRVFRAKKILKPPFYFPLYEIYAMTSEETCYSISRRLYYRARCCQQDYLQPLRLEYRYRMDKMTLDR